MKEGDIQVIKPQRSIFEVNLKEIWRYRDLLVLFVRRDFVSQYKQTILGPIWFFIQPIFTTLIFTFVFGRVGNFAPEGKPAFLYYLAGIVLWQYFADSLVKTSNTFNENQNIFGKVYFPRLIMPLSVISSNLLKLGVQIILFVSFYAFYLFQGGTLEINSKILFLPLLILLMAGMGLGFGLIISSLTTKYRDLRFLVSFGVQLLMYVTPGIIMSYSEFLIQAPKYAWAIKLNPMGPVIEAFKHATINAGTFSVNGLIYSAVFTIILLIFGTILFNKTEQNFMDTV